MTAPLASFGICGTDRGFLSQSPLNGSTPRIEIFLMLFNIPFILLNGKAITLFIPPIKPFTTVLNTLAIPSLIPSKIFPPVEKTFFTPCHASVNTFLNQPTTSPKAFLIPDHILPKNPVMLDQAFFTPFTAVSNTFPNHEPTLEKIFLISFHISEKSF